jgi:predicted TPR repeat methyltransferase
MWTAYAVCYANDFHADLRKFYDEKSEHYEELVLKTFYIGPDWVKRKIKLLKNGQKRLLDLGCANGMIAEIIKEFRPNYLFDGVDYSKGMVEACLKKKVYVNTHWADLSEGLPRELASSHYDVVLAIGCLEFISNHEDLFKEIHGVMNQGGQFWLTVQASFSKNEFDNEFPLDIQTYLAEDIKNLLLDSGYKIIEFELCESAYLRSKDQTAIPYFLIIAER